MATFNKFHCFVEDLSEGVHNLGTNTLKVILSNTVPVAGNTVYTDITEIANGGGYTTGGSALTLTSSNQSGGLYKLIVQDLVFTASTGFGPFRYVVIYNDTSGTDALIGWYDVGTSVTLGAAQTFTCDFDATNGILTLV